MQTRSRFAAATGALVLIAAACGSSTGSAKSAAKESTTSSTEATAGAMKLPAFADAMKVSVTSPATGTTVTENAVTLDVAASGFKLSCDLAGKGVAAGVGHYHILLDKSLVNMFCTPQATVSLQNVQPGTHELEVVPALNDHQEVMGAAQTVTFDYQPSSPAPAITDATDTAAPTIQIVSPKPGETVRGKFDVVVKTSHFNNSCDLYGKPSVAGYGHWHLNLNTATGPMMGMATMAGMSCETTFHASTAGLAKGSTQRLIALLVDNGHAPLSPSVMDNVTVKVG